MTDDEGAELIWKWRAELLRRQRTLELGGWDLELLASGEIVAKVS